MKKKMPIEPVCRRYPTEMEVETLQDLTVFSFMINVDFELESFAFKCLDL